MQALAVQLASMGFHPMVVIQALVLHPLATCARIFDDGSESIVPLGFVSRYNKSLMTKPREYA